MLAFFLVLEITIAVMETTKDAEDDDKKKYLMVVVYIRYCILYYIMHEPMHHIQLFEQPRHTIVKSCYIEEKKHKKEVGNAEFYLSIIMCKD